MICLMYELSHLVTEQEAGRRLDSLALGLLRVSRGQLKRLKFSGGIWVDGEPCHSDYRLRAGQRLCLRFEQDRPAAAQGKPGRLRIAYEDEHLLAIDKPAPLPAIASSHQQGESLQHWVEDYLGGGRPWLYRPVNRLDKGTSGLMLVAKSAHAQQLMQRQLHSPSFERGYLAITQGLPPEPRGLIDLPIGQRSGIRRYIDPSGKPSQTEYVVLRQAGERALLRLRLLTGRTHQIRVHLMALGCPVFGDFLYGQESPLLPGRLALHACALRFVHPLSGQAISLDSPLPKELQDLMP